MGKTKFDIFRASELTIRLYARTPSKGNQDTFLGYVKVSPAFGDENHRQMEWQPIENGTRKLLVEGEFNRNRTLRIETSQKERRIGNSRFNVVYKIRNSSTNHFYASINIQKADMLPRCDVVQSFRSPINNSPFIAPLKFIVQTRSYICLYWPLI
jgi:serum/glucocorticoid-regulated kinase 2